MKIPDFTNLVFPSNLKFILEDEGCWETEEYSPFFITIDLIEENDDGEGLLFSFQFNPNSKEFEDLNKAISSMGFDDDGFGWTDFLMQEIEKVDSKLSKSLDNDSESETCYLVTTSQQLFEKLLKHLKVIFHNLM
jgi:hypothetical protein